MEKIEQFCFKILEKIHLKKLVDIYKKNIAVMRYLIFGVLTTIINIVVYSLCFYILKIPNLISNIIAWIMAVIVAYLTNRKYVFDSKANTSKEIFIEVMSFTASRLATLGVDEAIMFFTVDKWGWNGLIMKIISNIIVIILNYVFSKVFVFKKEKNENN